MKRLSLFFLLLITLFVIGCNNGSEKAALAKINRSTITVEEFKEQSRDLQPQMRHQVAINHEAGKIFLNQLVGYEVVLQEAKRQGLHKEKDFIEKQNKFKREMERRIREATKYELIKKVLEKNRSDAIAPPTEEEVAQYYKEHVKEMRTAEGKKVSLQQAGPDIRAFLSQKKWQEALSAYAEELKPKAKITIQEDVLESLYAAPAQPGSSLQEKLQMQTPHPTDKETK